MNADVEKAVTFGDTSAGGLGFNIDKHKTAGILQQGMIELLRETPHD